MKSKFWIIIVSLVAVASLGISLWIFRPAEQAAFVKVISEGKVLDTLPLSEDTRFPIVSTHGSNIVTIKDGKVAVTEANCPDQYCVKRGFCDRGSQIVCLPNRLVLEFTGNSGIDGISG